MKLNRIILLFTSVILMLVLFVPVVQADGNYPVRITEQSVVVFPASENTLQAVHIVTFKNNGTEKEILLPLYLPKGFSQLELVEGLEQSGTQVNENGIVDTEGLDAGTEKNIVVSYLVPMSNGKSIWALEQSYVTERFEVVIPAGVLSFEAMNLLPQSELFEMNERQYRRFTRLDIYPDEPWTLSFRILGSQSQTEDINGKYTSDGKKIYGHKHGAGYTKAIVTLIIVFVALAVAWIGLKRDYLTVPHRKKNGQDRLWLRSERTLLLQQIGQLEKDYQSQLISQETYSNTRKEIRNKLVRIALEHREENS